MRDGATLQMGIGGIPDSVLKFCAHHKGLGIHSEMVSETVLYEQRPPAHPGPALPVGQVSDGMLDLVESGAVSNVHKKTDTGLIT